MKEEKIQLQLELIFNEIASLKKIDNSKLEEKLVIIQQNIDDIKSKLGDDKADNETGQKIYDKFLEIDRLLARVVSESSFIQHYFGEKHIITTLLLVLSLAFGLMLLINYLTLFLKNH